MEPSWNLCFHSRPFLLHAIHIRRESRHCRLFLDNREPLREIRYLPYLGTSRHHSEHQPDLHPRPTSRSHKRTVGQRRRLPMQKRRPQRSLGVFPHKGKKHNCRCLCSERPTQVQQPMPTDRHQISTQVATTHLPQSSHITCIQSHIQIQIHCRARNNWAFACIFEPSRQLTTTT